MFNKKSIHFALLCYLATSTTLALANDSYGNALVQANLVSDTATANQKVCIIGTGYDINHEDLPNGSNVTGDVSNTLSYSVDLGQWSTDTYGQGTHNAGIIAGLDNAIGMKGITPSGNINLHIVKVVHKSNWWPYINTGMTAAILNCQAAGANIISMGLASSAYIAEEEQALQAAYDSGILLIGASGNSGNSAYHYPASYSSVISVGAINTQAQPWMYSQNNDQIELVAPGVSINSTVPNDKYAVFDGTGSASAHVAGVAALVWSHFPSCNNQEIRDALTHSAMDLGEVGRDNIMGYGLVQAKRAVDHLATQSCASDNGSNIQLVDGIELTDENSRIVELNDGNTQVVWTEEINGNVQFSYQIFNSAGEAMNNKTILNTYVADYKITDVVAIENGGFILVMTQSTPEGDIIHTQLFDTNGAMVVSQTLTHSDPIISLHQKSTQETIDIATGDNWKMDLITAHFTENYLAGEYSANVKLVIDNNGVEHKLYQFGRVGSSNYESLQLIYQAAGEKEIVLKVPVELVVGGTSHLNYELALDKDNNPHVVFSYITEFLAQNNFDASTYRSYYAYRDAQGWHVKASPIINDARDFSLAIDNQGIPHLAYYTNQKKSYYAHFDGTNWQTTNIDAKAYEPTLALNINDEPVVIYKEFSSHTLYSATPMIVSPTYSFMQNTALPITGSKPDAVYDTKGRLHISSVTLNTSKIQHSVFDGKNWLTETVADSSYSTDTSIAVDNYDNPLIAYTLGSLFPYSNTHTYLADKRSGNWEVSKVLQASSQSTLNLAMDINNHPIIGTLCFLGYRMAHWAGVQNSYINGQVDQTIFNLGFTNTRPEGHYQRWQGGCIARPNIAQPAPKVEESNYVIATGANYNDYYLRFDTTGRFLTRMPLMYDASKNLQPGVTSNIDKGSSGVVVGDFDNDGLTDFITAGTEDETGDIIIEFNRKESSWMNIFSSGVHTPTQVISRPDMNTVNDIGDFAAADFNGDGNLDFVMADTTSANVHIYLGNGDGTFQTAYQITGRATHYGIDTADFNNDGHADFVASTTFNAWEVDLYMGDGTGNFIPLKVDLMRNGEGYHTVPGITASDFDNDGLVDIVLTNYSGNLNNGNGLAFYKGDGNASFSEYIVLSAPEMGKSVISSTAYRSIDNAYLNNDNFMDVIVSDSNKKAIRVYLGTGDGTFVHKDQHFAYHPEFDGTKIEGSGLSLLDPKLTEVYEYLHFARSDIPKGVATQTYSKLVVPNQ